MRVRDVSFIDCRVSAQIDPYTRTILLKPLAHMPRREFRIAHELIELHLPDPLEEWEHEAFCNAGAAELMMPEAVFVPSALSCHFDLAVLRRWWPHCSWDALTMRLAELCPIFAASAWDGARQRFRRTQSGVQTPREADDLEAFVAAEAAFSQRPSEVVLGGVVVRAWPTGGRRAVVVSASSDEA